ncbi:MAG: non-hydrolyzing UDP-N-acetylglucosamine 2-epimerase [Bacteroidia bacterium]
MMKIVTIIGARPQIIKAAALSRAINNKFSDKVREVIVHTGQHYDENMSAVFFSELNIPKPDYSFSIASATPVGQMASMLTGIEEVLTKEKPNAVVVYGDTNSTLAASIVCSKLNVTLVHIEAGLRSFNKEMPEEINRITCDNASTFLFSPTKTGVDNLAHEGIVSATKPPYGVGNPLVYHCGDVMYDNSLYFSTVADKESKILEKHGLKKNGFILATIHRNTNTDVPEKLNSLFSALYDIHHKNNMPVILPLHPRTRKCVNEFLDKGLLEKISSAKNFIICDPASFLDMIMLEKNCCLVMTDSGGVQKEAFYFEKPCVILRPETEWVELVESGTAIIADTDQHRISEAYTKLTSDKGLKFPKLFGDGKAAEFICSELVKHIS